MLEALRGLGYSTAIALADLIDNSIAAGAKTVHLRFFWAGPASLIHILDDGNGMDADELDRAMRLGEHSPLETRAAHDLGRFGLGLKTASLSQCRRLTVANCKQGQLHCLRWDLDEIARRSDDGWYLLEEAARGSAEYLRPLEEQERGTLILWEALDQIITPGFGEQAFLDLIDQVEQHLVMVFQRCASTPRPAGIRRLRAGGRAGGLDGAAGVLRLPEPTIRITSCQPSENLGIAQNSFWQ